MICDIKITLRIHDPDQKLFFLEYKELLLSVRPRIVQLPEVPVWPNFFSFQYFLNFLYFLHFLHSI